MTAKEPDVAAMHDPDAQLEEALIEGFLRARGLDLAAVHALPEDEAKRLLTAASLYASTKLAEIEMRAHFVHDIHSKE